MIFFKRRFRKLHLNYPFLNCSLLGILLLVIVVSLGQVNAGIYSSMEINRLKEEFKSLQIENEQLLEKEAAFKSMENLQEISQELNMIEVASIDYLRPNTDTLARLSR
ncbi:MAG: hypothetical protein Q7J06_03975 [Bacteroidales bacterium]|nr:hypothetical protein [Bacteroidales bacterium]